MSANMDLIDAEERGAARQALVSAYRRDVDLLAQEMNARIRRGEFDNNYPWFTEFLLGAVEKHSRVADQALVFETIAYSENRNVIENDFADGWWDDVNERWLKLQAFDPEEELQDTLTLPPWRLIASHAFYRDVNDRIYAILGDTPEAYVATRLGHKST